MGRMYLFSIILLSALTQCCKFERSAFADIAGVETDRSALERAGRAVGQEGAPSRELFVRTIADVRNRFGDVAADVLIDRVLARAPDYAPAHLARAESLFRHGRHEAVIVEGNLALDYSDHISSHQDSSRAELRAIHTILAQAYLLVGDAQRVREHRQWLNMNRFPSNNLLGHSNKGPIDKTGNVRTHVQFGGQVDIRSEAARDQFLP